MIIGRLKGGLGSGFHGHKGRKGEVGGSIARGVLSTTDKPITIDSMGVRVRDAEGVAKGVDAGIADTLEELHKMGYNSAQSASGLMVDYPYPDRRSRGVGYIAFWKHKNTPEQLQSIKDAAIASGMYIGENDIFFSPAITVRMPYTNDMSSFDVLRDQANAVADKFSGGDYKVIGTDKFLSTWLPKREATLEDLIDKHGGKLIDDTKVSNMWDSFITNLKTITYKNKEFQQLIGKLAHQYKGGVGSGFHGHKGRLGQEGGSLPRGVLVSSSNDSKRVLTDFVDKVSNMQENSIYGVVKRHGKFYIPQELPKKYKLGKPKLCYMNAYYLASAHDELQYVEGLAIPDFADIPIEHAWCVDKSGNVVDNTWKTAGNAYYGVPFEDAFISSVLSETGMFGVITYQSKAFRDKYAVGDSRNKEL